MIVLTFAQAISDGGVSQAILRAEALEENVLSSLYWLNVIVGFVVAVVVVAVSPLVGSFFGDSDVTDVLRWTALVFVLMPWGQQFMVLLQRDLRFRTIALTQVCASCIATGLAIVSAALGAGALALAWGWIAFFAVQAAVFAAIGWRRWAPRLRFRRRDMNGYLRFGVYRMGDRLLNAATANMDYLMVGRFLGAHALGLYSLSYQIVIRPLLYINPVLVKVAFPVFARRQRDDDALQRGYGHVLRILGYLVFPLLLGIAVTAHVFVPLLLGDQWESIVPLLEVMWGVGALRCISNAALPVALSRGRADIGFRVNLGSAIAMGLVLLGAAQLSLQAVAWGELFVVCGQALLWWYLLRREIHLSPISNARTVARPLLIAGFGAALAWLSGALAAGLGASSLLQLILMLVVGAAGFGALALVVDGAYLRTMARLLGRRGRVVEAA
jgi:O-antigen/teichoic acid export membrane protein